MTAENMDDDDEVMSDYVWRCGKRWAHTKMIAEDMKEIVKIPEGWVLLLEQIEGLMGGEKTHEHQFVLNFGSFALKDSYIYDCEVVKNGEE